MTCTYFLLMLSGTKLLGIPGMYNSRVTLVKHACSCWSLSSILKCHFQPNIFNKFLFIVPSSTCMLWPFSQSTNSEYEILNSLFFVAQFTVYICIREKTMFYFFAYLANGYMSFCHRLASFVRRYIFTFNFFFSETA